MGLLEQVTLSGTDSKDKNISKYFYNNAGLQIKMYTGMSSENDTSYLTTNYEYDSWLRAVRTTDSTGYNSGTITYDLNGNVLTNTDANDNITTNTYDALNHVLTSKTVNSKDYKKNVSKSYEYDNMGRILRAVTNDLTTYYAYDDLGRKIEEIEGKNGYSTFKGFFYEGVSQYAREELIGQYNLLLYSSKTYEYDGEMRVVKVKESGNETASYTYDANGNKKSETLANGVVSTYDYNNANRIVKLVNKKGNSTISSYEYSYYLDGSDACKKTTENGIIETTEYEYDGLKRLTNEEVKKGNTTDTYSYEYDDYGNRSKMTATGSENYVTEYSYNNAQGKYTALLQKEVKTVEGEENALDLNSNVKQTVYIYDANGNQITKTAEGKTETNTYDGLNQLIGFTDGETTASYKYNASGLRYEKTVNGETINHVWDGNKQIVADVIDNQFYEADCYIRGTNLVAKYNYWNGKKTEYTYYTQNAHGDVVNLTDKEGKVTKSYRYDAFGVEKNIDENDTNAFRYCGEYYDKETATVYLRARYYNPNTGRFISRDSYVGRRTDPLSLNLYTYCANNPVYFFDPSGYSYGTLPDGTKMSINSAWDAKVFNELRDKQLSTEVNAKKNTYADPNDAFGLNKQQQEANAEYIYNYLSNEGWSINAICGLLGNIQQESQMNPGAWQIGFENNKSSSNCGYGLIQFTPAEDFLPKIGLSIDNIDEYAERKPGELIDLQLKYLISSCQPDQYVWLSEMGVNIYGSPYEMAFDEFITSSNNPGELALVFHGHYERSADDEFTQNNRVEYANYWYNYFNN